MNGTFEMTREVTAAIAGERIESVEIEIER